MKKIASLFLVTAITLACRAQTWNDTLKKIDDILSRYQAANPGCELAISRNGKLLYSTARGMADLEHNVPLTNTSLTEAGSVSKQFTAASILLLEQQGKLSLQDDVRKYIPELPVYDKPIAIQHLLHHTSGLRDWGAVMELAGWPRGSRNYTNAHALLIIARQKALNNLPGDEFLYSNSNYTLLTIIVERVSGKSLQDFTHDNIFVPAGMQHTQWRTNMKTVVPNRAMAYARVGGIYQTNMPNENVYGHGGLLTTAEDLLAWNNFYWSGKLGAPSLLNRQLATASLNNGQHNSYAAGLFIDSARGWKLVTHNGATASYRANLDHYPELGLSIAWLSNTSEYDRDTFNIPEALGRLFVKDITPKKAAAPLTPVTVPQALLPAYAGWYQNAKTGAGMHIRLQQGLLYEGKTLLTLVNNNTFMIGNRRISFSTSPAKQAVITNERGLSTLYNGVDSITSYNQQEYTGEYYSAEVEAGFSITVKDNQLQLVQPPTIDVTLTPTYKDGFDCRFGPLYFERDANNHITGFKVSLERARKVQFAKTH